MSVDVCYHPYFASDALIPPFCLFLEIEVHQHYEMKNAVIRLPDLAIQHPEFMDDYVSDRPYIAIFRPSVQPLLLDGTYANLASAFSQSEKVCVFRTQFVKQTTHPF